MLLQVMTNGDRFVKVFVCQSFNLFHKNFVHGGAKIRKKREYSQGFKGEKTVFKYNISGKDMLKKVYVWQMQFFCIFVTCFYKIAIL